MIWTSVSSTSTPRTARPPRTHCSKASTPGTLTATATEASCSMPFEMKRLLSTLAAGAALAAAAPAHGAVVELGVTPDPPSVTCPDNCNAVGRVTGYQILQKGGKRNPFRAPSTGKAVAFTLRLGDPSQQQIDSFADVFD